MKKTLIALLGIIVVILAIAFVAPKDFKIEREITINRTQEEVFEYLRMLKNADNWSPWIQKDPAMSRDFKGTDGTVGYIQSWSGNNQVGAGEEEIISIVKNERIDLELRFTKPMQATNKAYYVTESVGKDQTRVIWGMTGRTEFPFNIVCFFMKQQVIKDFDEGLKNLKNILEENEGTERKIDENDEGNAEEKMEEQGE